MVQDSAIMNMIARFMGLALLSGCSTNPITGRNQILAIPEVQVAYADVGFALSTGAQPSVASPSCEQACGGAESLARFAGRVVAIGAQLKASVRDMFPEQFARVETFQIEVNGSLGVGTGSSASGRIALGAGLAELEPTDTVIAFLIAREMAHVIARHAEEDSGASILFSTLGMLLPGINVVIRFVASKLGSGALRRSWATQQDNEADQIAISLLERTGRPALSVALGLESGMKRALLPDDEWGARYIASMQRVRLIAASPLRYAVSGN